MIGVTPYRDLGDRIRHLRHQAGLRQVDCAVRAGIQQSQLSTMERGLNRCSPVRLRRLAAVLSADYDELVRLAGYRN